MSSGDKSNEESDLHCEKIDVMESPKLEIKEIEQASKTSSEGTESRKSRSHSKHVRSSSGEKKSLKSMEDKTVSHTRPSNGSDKAPSKKRSKLECEKSSDSAIPTTVTDDSESISSPMIKSSASDVILDVALSKLGKEMKDVESTGTEEHKGKASSASPKNDSSETAIIDVQVGDKSQSDLSSMGKDKGDKGATETSTKQPSSVSGEIEVDGKSEKSDKSPAPSPYTKHEHKKDGEKKKSKKKTCEECHTKKRSFTFQVFYQGKACFLCSDDCFKKFKSKQNQSKSTAEPPSKSKQAPPACDNCGYCKKKIKTGEGFYPELGEIKPLCSDDCVKKYEENEHPPKYCAQCKKMVEDRFNYLTWETMAYCNEDCLRKYQSFLGCQCMCCQSPVQQSSLGKYCVCFGSDIKQFCSGGCLEEFKKSLKVCTFCQTDLSSVDAFLAPVGEMGSFKDFCSQPCMVQYEVMNKKLEALKKVRDCAQCGKQGTLKKVIKYEDKWYGLCCNQCVGGFRCSKKIKLNLCETCCKIIQPEDEQKFTITHEGMHKNFCTRPCMTLYTLSNRKIVPCHTCKVKKYNFDMIEKFDKTEDSKVFCSLNCLSLYNVCINVTSAQNIRCDHCTKYIPAKYHLTMSDGSVRNFCDYPCVLMFQGQFPDVPALTSASSTRPVVTTARTASVTSSTPVIASVMSLAAQPPRSSSAPNAASKFASQKSLSRNPSSPLSMSITKTQGTSPSYPSSSSATSGSSGQPVFREVIVRPPQPKSVKNKTVSCRPIMQTKGILCKPHPCHKAVQTDDRPLPFIVPVPLPVYIPLLCQMYSRPVPVPVPFGIPIPFPIVVPALTKDAQGQTVETADSQVTAPSTSTDESKTSKKSTFSENGTKNLKDQEAGSGEKECSSKDSKKHSHGKRKHSSHGSEPSEKRVKPNDTAVQTVDLPPVVPETEHQTYGTFEEDFPEKYDSRLKHMQGVYAYREWIDFKREQVRQGVPMPHNFTDFRKNLTRLVPSLLNYLLSLFIKEARKPNGDELMPASLFYVLLGIQQHLYLNNRYESLFFDPKFDSVTSMLFYVARNHELRIEAEIAAQAESQVRTLRGGTKAVSTAKVTNLNYSQTLVDEHTLWETYHLGALTPFTFLGTLMYFNTKYFKLKTVEDHCRLSFTHFSLINTSSEGSSRNSYYRNKALRYYPPINRVRPRRGRHPAPITFHALDEEGILDSMCPVKYYEFYLTVCPDHVRESNHPFYLTPVDNWDQNPPRWFSTRPISLESATKILQRIHMVREISAV